ncbi:F1F0 ATP synthase subunit 5 [Lachancea thermotolerans CBS 6340]|uniref:ATP synthase subunit 5, mitochondrial n=1 Tax=Lachancea thermotolerans (strain ATCC 56472 / CBS 6340 / NRRL Y-8284) TaxID=559295 RepID=C5DM53_LACTC|nr:KLTH0G06072p [Lachancea thermotolerans CBS 6340]CAR24864.1 KLTH0G06072p [Lachancea thermotolerans CBS 6340]
MFSKLFTRSLATASKSVKPPIQLFGLDGTYATALFTAAAKTTSVEAASKSLSQLTETVTKDSKLTSILANPALSANDRAIVVDTLAKSQPNIDQSVANLLKVLGENNRLSLFPDVSIQFTKLTDAYNGLIQATVTTAQPLDSKLFKRVEKALAGSKLVGQGKTLKLENVVDPEIQGGLIVEVADRTVDLSISSKINKLNQLLKEAV